MYSGPNGAMESSFSQLLHQMACLHPCMVWEVETGMIHFSFLTVATVQEYLQSPTQQPHEPLTFESFNEYDQSNQQDFFNLPKI